MSDIFVPCPASQIDRRDTSKHTPAIWNMFYNKDLLRLLWNLREGYLPQPMAIMGRLSEGWLSSKFYKYPDEVIFRVIRLYGSGFSEPGKVVDIGRKKVMGWVKAVFGFCLRNSPVSQSRAWQMGILEKNERTLTQSRRGDSESPFQQQQRVDFNGPSFNLSTKALLFESNSLPFYNLQLFLSQ